jgi:hypothetical protein
MLPLRDPGKKASCLRRVREPADSLQFVAYRKALMPTGPGTTLMLPIK